MMMIDFKTKEARVGLDETLNEEYKSWINRYPNGREIVRKRGYNRRLWNLWKAEDNELYRNNF
jgi:hypothetical protein